MQAVSYLRRRRCWSPMPLTGTVCGRMEFPMTRPWTWSGDQSGPGSTSLTIPLFCVAGADRACRELCREAELGARRIRG